MVILIESLLHAGGRLSQLVVRSNLDDYLVIY